MSLTPSPYVCPRWLRNPHAQSLLASSPLRSARGRVRLRQARAQHRPMLLTLRSNVRLQGIASLPMHTTPRALVLLLHGWEGSAESSYMRLTAARLLHAGCAVFRLNFRDHGGSHHLNQGLFHSNRIDEVVDAAGVIAQQWPDLPLLHHAAFACAPANAHIEAKAAAHFVTQTTGGMGAARELVDVLLQACGQYQVQLEKHRRGNLQAGA